jgi:hypothetical protein
VVGIAGIIILAALFIGFRDGGMIDVNGKITATDQSGMSEKVNLVNRTNEPNGGLKPVTDDPNAPRAPETPPSPPLTPMDTEVNDQGNAASTTSEEAPPATIPEGEAPAEVPSAEGTN